MILTRTLAQGRTKPSWNWFHDVLEHNQKELLWHYRVKSRLLLSQRHRLRTIKHWPSLDFLSLWTADHIRPPAIASLNSILDISTLFLTTTRIKSGTYQRTITGHARGHGKKQPKTSGVAKETSVVRCLTSFQTSADGLETYMTRESEFIAIPIGRLLPEICLNDIILDFSRCRLEQY